MTGPARREEGGKSRRGTQERALRRREALLDAAVDLLGEGGFTAVTHRAVAERAGIPLAATSYYFSSRDELVADAFALLVERDLLRMRASAAEAGAGSLVESARTILRTYAPDRGRQLGLWELYLQAGREPALQHIARTWTDGWHDIVRTLLDRAGHPCGDDEVRFVATLVSGLWLELLVEDRPGSPERAGETVARALRAITECR
ncbi:TetR/AcrR family transcriptional regulator [Microtetraspora niveoalba]|uniref:TetR/AcrR family transcriptional regulator n=1 Tax=Microtetraspora niveoalba TaxID=46175 RepID=UPI000836732F|nr:TetR/AcrR family transcriptional regulator [Microtetraspora niveoalba]